MTQRLDVKTMPEYFGMPFDSKALRVVSSVIAFFTYVFSNLYFDSGKNYVIL
ncbi:MAG: hypothetical protein K2I10_05950 [Lachnospiraceae bacterium]|nr:hypothetical protein [Lachnospiraceae bacterium]